MWFSSIWNNFAPFAGLMLKQFEKDVSERAFEKGVEPAGDAHTPDGFSP